MTYETIGIINVYVEWFLALFSILIVIRIVHDLLTMITDPEQESNIKRRIKNKVIALILSLSITGIIEYMKKYW